MYTLEQLRMFADMPFLVFVKDEDLNYVWANNSFLELIDLGSLDELVRKSDHELIWSGYADELNENDRAALRSGEPVTITERSDIPGKGTVGATVRKFPITLDGKRALMGIAIITEG